MINIILFGPPGSGKGTQASKLAEKYNLIHISTGDLFRYEMSNDTPLGQLAKSFMSEGKLVPDQVTIDMLKAKMERHPDVEGFIFDGFPRTIPQAEALITLLEENGEEILALIALDVNEDEIIHRLTRRGKEAGRADDMDEAIIRNRIQVYRNETQPVYDHFAQFGKSHLIKGVGSIDEIFDGISQVVESRLDNC